MNIHPSTVAQFFYTILAYALHLTLQSHRGQLCCLDGRTLADFAGLEQGSIIDARRPKPYDLRSIGFPEMALLSR